MHNLLQRQLRRFLDNPEDLPAELRQLLQAVDEAYKNHDEDRQLIERSLELMSNELIEQNVKLRDELAERRRAEEQLSLWSKVFENSSEGIFITDTRHRIISVNPAFSSITGYRPEEVLGAPPHLLNGKPHPRDFSEKIWATVETVGHWQGEILARHKSTQTYPAWVEITSAKTPQGVITNYIVMFSDISARKAAEERIQFLAYHDYLTGLPNRLLLRDRLQIALAHARRRRQYVAVLFIDLDRFKNINDSLGHQVGDTLLQQVGERLTQCVRPDDTVSRLGGDEFIIILNDIPSPNIAGKIAAKAADALARPYDINGAEFHISPSTGISIYPNDGEDIDSLIKNADAAMYFAKESGRNNYQFFTSDLNSKSLKRLSMETSLRRALERNELVLHYQPQIHLRTGRIIGMEALVRWQHPELGLITPHEFIPLAEDTGLILPLGEWVLRTACAKAKKWQDAGLGPFHIAVNFSARQFLQQNLTRQVAAVLKDTGLDPRLLELELTESLMMANPEEATRTLAQLKGLGVRFSIDDFGTGYSSLGYLKRFPIDKLKIDQTFVHEITTGRGDGAIVTAIITLSHSLNLQVVAEGVETADQLAYLRTHRCDGLQGTLFCPPLPEEEIPVLLDQRKREFRSRLGFLSASAAG